MIDVGVDVNADVDIWLAHNGRFGSGGQEKE